MSLRAKLLVEMAGRWPTNDFDAQSVEEYGVDCATWALKAAADLLKSHAQYDESQGEGGDAEVLEVGAMCIEKLMAHPEMVPCDCPGCDVPVEAWSRSGMCFSCADEDCQHEWAPE